MEILKGVGLSLYGGASKETFLTGGRVEPDERRKRVDSTRRKLHSRWYTPLHLEPPNPHTRIPTPSFFFITLKPRVV